MQGDEKDIIVFSIGYAPDPKGKLLLQFGSLNMAGGENRLNVAITRAREKIIVVCSLWPEELHTDDTKNKGPKLLKEYLRFARLVSDNHHRLAKPKPNRHLDWYLKFRLPISEDKALFDFFPNADMVMKEGDGFGNLILTDDEYYQQALSAKHHHALLPKLLEEKKWKHHAVYSRNFWRDREKFLLDLEGHLI